MAFLVLLEIIAQVAMLTLVVTQVVVPIVTGGKWFPLFRRKELAEERRHAEEEVARLQEELRIQALHEQAEELKSHRHDGQHD